MTTISNSERAGAGARILYTAAGLFAKFGYNGVSTRDIASGASVNEVTIYRHYPRKRDLYVTVLNQELQQVKLRGDLLARMAEATEARTALVRAFELIGATLMHNPDLLRLVQFSTLELGEEIDPLLRNHLGQLVEVVAHYLEPWAKKGKLRGSSTKAVVLALIAMVVNFGSLQRLFLAGGPGPELMFSALTDFWDIPIEKANFPAAQVQDRSEKPVG